MKWLKSSKLDIKYRKNYTNASLKLIKHIVIINWDS
jgi:hypothetical protein